MNRKLKVDKNIKANNIKGSIETHIKKNINIVIDQLVNPPEYPENKVLAKFASLAYDPNIENIDLTVSNLSEWKFIAKEYGKNNYEGITYFNPDKMHIVIAHKGTRDFKDYYTDLKGIYSNNVTGQMDAACTFVSKIIEAVKLIQREYKTLHFEIFITGHSLGGWLAQITSFSSKYLKTENEKFVKSNDTEGIHTHTVAFDSPGCKEMLEKLKDRYFQRNDHKKILEYLDIITYLSSPNLVNMINTHFGQVYRLMIDFQNLSWYQEKIMYTMTVHSINEIVTFFENENPTINNVLDWPHGCKEYIDFFGSGEKTNNFHFENYYFNVRYKAESVNKNEIYIKVFTQKEINFFICYNILKPHNNMNDYIEDKLKGSYEDENTKFEKIDFGFKITESDTMKYKSQKFVPLMKKLFFFHPEIISELATSSNTYEIYKKETKTYCEENKFKTIKFDKDFLELCKSDSYIWQFKTNNINLCMAQLYNELETSNSTFIMLKLERLLLFNAFKSFKSLFPLSNDIKYIVIVCDDQDNHEYVENSLKYVFDKLKPNIHIIVVTNEVVELKQDCFKDIKSELVKLSFSQLNKETQREILYKQCITLNNHNNNNNNNNRDVNVCLKDVLKTDNITEEMDEIITPVIISHILINKKIIIDTDFVKTSLSDNYIDRKFIDDNGKEKESLDEKIIILSDKAGMGKSMLLTKIFEVKKNDQQQLWLITINLTKYIEAYEEFEKQEKKPEDIDLFIALFFKTRSENEIDKFRNKLLKYNLKSMENVVIFFDAYDGVSSQYNKIILHMLDGLKNIGIKCMWIATRTHCKNELIEKLEVKSYSINPFSTENQIDFLQKYWNSKLNKPTEDIKKKTKINKFSEKIVSDIGFPLNGKELLSIPLHIYMLAEYYKKHCEDICNSSTLTVEEIDFNKNLRITKLYEHIVHEKIKNYLDNNKESMEKNPFTILKSYEDFALSLENKTALKKLKRKEPCDVKKNLNRNIGFIDSTDGNKVVFTPTILLEYFIFNYIKRKIYRWEVVEMLFLGALKDSNKQILRLFLNDYLKNKKIKFITKKHRKNLNTKKLRHKIILQSTEEGTVNILKFISKYFENTDKLKKLINAKNERGETALHIAAQKGECVIVKILLTALHKIDRKDKVDRKDVLLRHNQDIINVKDTDKMTPLHKAAQNGRAGVVEILIDNKAKIDIKNKNGRTALEEAKYREHQNVVDILLRPILLN